MDLVVEIDIVGHFKKFEILLFGFFSGVGILKKKKKNISDHLLMLLLAAT